MGTKRLQHHHDSAPPKPGTTGNIPGFDTEPGDIVDFITRITYQIWEGKQVGLCYDYYSANCPVYTLADMSIGAEAVVQSTLGTLAAFPDRTLAAENIIWSGNAGDGFHSSHRIRSVMTHKGDSDFGPATHKQATIRGFAHCVVKDNQIIKEWLVRDNYALAQQLGFDPHRIAQNQAQTEPSERFGDWYRSEFERLSPSNLSRTELCPKAEDDPEAFIRASLQNVWNARMLGDIYKLYAETAQVHGPGGRRLSGHEAIIQYYLQLLGTFSGLCIAIDHVCSQPAAAKGIDLAVRWTMAGKHTGHTLYGPPTAADVLIIGESHYLIIDGLIQKEWSLFDELAVLTRLYRARRLQP